MEGALAPAPRKGVHSPSLRFSTNALRRLSCSRPRAIPKIRFAGRIGAPAARPGRSVPTVLHIAAEAKVRDVTDLRLRDRHNGTWLQLQPDSTPRRIPQLGEPGEPMSCLFPIPVIATRVATA